MFPCPTCGNERSEIEASCGECGWLPGPTSTERVKTSPRSKSFDPHGEGQIFLGSAITLFGLWWLSLIMNPGAIGPFVALAERGGLPHFIPLFSGLTILFAGLVSRKFNAIPMLVAFGLIFGYVYWLST